MVEDMKEDAEPMNDEEMRAWGIEQAAQALSGRPSILEAKEIILLAERLISYRKYGF